MEKIIKVTYNRFIVESNSFIEKERKYYTNMDTLEEAIEAVRIEMQKRIEGTSDEIVSIVESSI